MNIKVDFEKLSVFCKKWNIVEFALFGSVLRNDFNSESDVDVLVSFDQNTNISLFDLVEMQEELESFFGREVDIIERTAIKNPYRMKNIFANMEFCMLPEERDLSLLWDMLEAAKDVVAFIENVKFSDFENDKKLRYATERQILVIGEAAKNISESTKKDYSEIPWKSIVGMRNILAHEYGEVLTSRIWSTAKNDIPNLIAKINAALKSLEQNIR